MNVYEFCDFLVGAVLARVYKALSLLKLRPNINKVTEQIWVGGANHPSQVVEEGFEAVVDLRENEDRNLSAQLRESGIEYLRKPTPDGFGMAPKTLLDTVKWIRTQANQGAKVLIHCNLGRGRAGLVATSYLVHAGRNPTSALKFVKKRRRVTYLNRRQKQALYAFAKIHRSVKGKA